MLLLARTARNSSELDEEYKDFISSYKDVDDMLLPILHDIWEKSGEPREHGERMAVTSWRIGRKMKLTEERLLNLVMVAKLHDIGKIIVPERILSKPGKLTTIEYEEVKKHSLYGERIARLNPDIRHVADEILSHHERWDGKGYPYGLAGVTIPLLSRIVAITDAYDIMTHEWAYHPAIPSAAAVQELVNHSGTQFDPDIVQVFLQVLYDEF